jgi:hypothetical protein
MRVNLLCCHIFFISHSSDIRHRKLLTDFGGIIPHHPASSRIIPHHPALSRIIPHHPASSHIIPHHPASSPLCDSIAVEIKCINVRRNTTVFSNCWRRHLHVSALSWVGRHQVETRIYYYGHLHTSFLLVSLTISTDARRSSGAESQKLRRLQKAAELAQIVIGRSFSVLKKYINTNIYGCTKK